MLARFKYLAVSSLGIIILLGGAAVAQASHSWGGYHWARAANPFAIKLGDDVSTTWDSYLALASSDWSVSNVLDTNVVAGATNSKNCRPVAGRVEVCNNKYGNTTWLGVAQIWVNGAHITQGTVRLNDTYFNTPAYNKPALKQFVACQEIGHTLGLAHQDEALDNPNLGTCMDYTNDPARNDGVGDNLHPNQHDYDELALIYAHFDSATALKTKNNTGQGQVQAQEVTDDIDVSASDQWGTIVRKSKDGRSSLHERDLGNGKKVFTFVIWAEPR